MFIIYKSYAKVRKLEKKFVICVITSLLTIVVILTGEKKMETATLERRIESKVVDKTVQRIALYNNPVELVNNMYGCHPNRDGSDYFSKIYKNL